MIRLLIDRDELSGMEMFGAGVEPENLTAPVSTAAAKVRSDERE